MYLSSKLDLFEDTEFNVQAEGEDGITRSLYKSQLYFCGAYDTLSEIEVCKKIRSDFRSDIGLRRMSLSMRTALERDSLTLHITLSPEQTGFRLACLLYL